MELLKKEWQGTTRLITAPITMDTGKDCFGFRAVNKGDSIAIVNQSELLPFPPGHPEISGESMADVHPLAWPMVQQYITIGFRGGSGNNDAVQITIYNNY